MSSAGFVPAYSSASARISSGSSPVIEATLPSGNSARRRRYSLEPVRVRLDELRVVQAGVHDHSREAERQRGVGAGPGLEMEVGRIRRVGLPGIDDDDAGALRLGVEDQPPLVDVGFRGIVAPQQDETALDGLRRMIVEVCAIRQACRLEAGWPAQVAERCGAAAELPPERHREPAEGAMRSGPLVVQRGRRSVRIPQAFEPLGDLTEGVLPADRLETRARRLLPERPQQAVGAGHAAGVRQALQADVASRRRVLGVAFDRDDTVALVEGDEHAACAIAVARADGPDGPQRRHRRRV